MDKKLLEGVKVVDFGQIATIPLTTKYFADCGAVVVKIEGKTRMDSVRNSIPHKDGIVGVNRSARFGQWNTSKLSVALNLTHPKAVEVAKRLVAWGDVVTDNFAAGVMERLGLGYEDLRKVKPNIIMFSSCLQGHTGPGAQNRGTGSILVALTGVSHITGWPDREPPDLGPYTDFINPHFHAFIVVAALDHRRRTGQGMYLDMSQQECCLQFLAPSLPLSSP